MTKQLKQAIYALLEHTAQRGHDARGHIHYIDQSDVDAVAHWFVKECRKEGDLQYIGKRYGERKG